jgi:hypothetical protein
LSDFKPRAKCEHKHFACNVDVVRLENATGKISSFVAEMRITCADCGTPFQFFGLKAGYLTQTPTMSVDGLQAHLPIAPEGSVLSPADAIGYTIGLGRQN